MIDDHPIVRMGVVHLIESNWPEADLDEAETVAQARIRIAAARPDLISLDLALPDAQGTEALAQLLRIARGVPILVLSQGHEASHAQRAMRMGAAGYLGKDRAGTELVQAVTCLLRGGRYVHAELASRLLSMLDGQAPPTTLHDALTSQEYRVMQLIASGTRASRIASTMNLSVKTVANYRARIFAKTGWRNNIDLTKYCVQHGLTTLE